MVEVIRVEIINRNACATRTDKRISGSVLIKQRLQRREVLIGEVAAHGPFVGNRVVGFADARQQHQVNIVELEGGEDHQVTGLTLLAALPIYIGNASCTQRSRSI